MDNSQSIPEVENQEVNYKIVFSLLKQFGLFPLLASVIIFFLYILLAIYLVNLSRNYLVKRIKTVTLSPTPLPTQVISPTPIPTVDVTADWKIYSNKQLGISFKYPNDWEIKPIIRGYKIEKFMAHEILDLVKQLNEYQTSIGTLYYYDNPDNLSLVTFDEKRKQIEKSGSAPNLYSSNDTPIRINDNVNGYYRENAFCEPVYCDINIWSYYNKIFVLMRFKDKMPNQNEIFDQILSTFKFLDISNPATPTPITNTPTSTKPVCTKDADCPSSYFCDYGISCSLPNPNGKTNCQEEGSKACIKSCNTDTDCTNEEKCQYFSIPNGDAFFLKKGCR